MREIPVSRITDAVVRLCIEANTHLPDDVKRAIEACRACEDGDIAVGVLDNIMENYQIADRECVPICQDTGMACVFLEIGQDVHLTGGDLREAVDEGVRRGYTNGFLRKSVVRDPVRRGNTGDNTPAVLYTEIVPGEQVKITLAPKGFGSENRASRTSFLRRWRRQAPIHARPSSSAWASAAPSTRRRCWRKKPSCVRWTPGIPIPSMPIWKRKCWKR